MSNARTSYDYRTVVVSSPRAGVVLATLSRPERLNAITFEMFDEFRVLQRAVDADPEARVLVLHGAGRGFCAGLDLDQAQTLPDMSAAEMLAGQEQWAWSGAIAETTLAVMKMIMLRMSTALRLNLRAAAVKSGPPTATPSAYTVTSSPAAPAPTRGASANCGSIPAITNSAIPTEKAPTNSANRAAVDLVSSRDLSSCLLILERLSELVRPPLPGQCAAPHRRLGLQARW
jgi:hypothetical protein